MLKLFDQDAKKERNNHRLLLIKKIFPGFLERIINRLKSADADNPDLEEQMNAEDEYLAELIKRDNEISYFKLKYNETAIELEKKDKALGEKDKALGEKDNIILKYAKSLKESGNTTKEIQRQTKLSKDEIEKL